MSKFDKRAWQGDKRFGVIMENATVPGRRTLPAKDRPQPDESCATVSTRNC